MATQPYNTPRKIYAVIVGTIGLGLLAWGLLMHPPPQDQWLFILVLMGLGTLLNSIGTNLPMDQSTYIGLEATAYYAAILTLDPWAAGLIAAAHMIYWRFAQ